MLSDEKLEEVYSQIPTDTEILVTHQPPFNMLDHFHHVPPNDKSRMGSKVLQKEMENRLRPLYHIFGHIHEGYGTQEANGTVSMNASNVDEKYRPINPPLFFTLPRKEGASDGAVKMAPPTAVKKHKEDATYTKGDNMKIKNPSAEYTNFDDL